MERPVKPENLFIGRKRWIPAVIGFALLVFGLALAIFVPIGLSKYPPEDEQTAKYLIVCTCILSPVSILYAVLNLKNLFFPYLLTADEKGVYNYSGFFHYGFIAWEDIDGFTNNATVLDVMDGEQPCLRIFVKDFKKYKSGLSLYRKSILFFSGSNIKIFTTCSQIKRKELYRLLKNMHSYYDAPEQTVDFNE